MGNEDSLDDKGFEELLELKEDIEEKLKFFRENASQESVEKLGKHKSKIKDKSRLSGNFEDDFSNMDKRQQKRAIKKLSFSNNLISMANQYIKAFQSDIDLGPGRLMGLSDGIFSIVMTLLVFGMVLPEIEILTAGDFSLFVQSMIPNIGVTIVSFILLASFWIYHHQFFKLKSLNIPLLWLNMFFLASLCFIPFTTSVIGTYSKFFLADVLFGLNILIVLILLLLMLKYADRMNFLENEITLDGRKYVYHTFYLIMGLTIVVNLLDFYVSQNFFYLFLLVPVISIIRDIRFRLKHA